MGAFAGKNKLFRFVTSMFFRFSIVLSSFIIFLISSYLYGPEGRGVISFVGSFFFALSLIFSFGLGRVVYQRISVRPEEGKVYLPAAVSFIYFISLIGLAIVALGINLPFIQGIIPTTVRPLYFILLFGIFPYNLWLIFSNFLFSAIKKTARHEVYIFLTRFCQVLLLGSLYIFKGPLENFLFIYGVSGFLIFVFESIILLSDDNLVSLMQGFRHIKSLFSDALWPYVDSIAQSAYPLVIFLIGMRVNSVDLGNFHFSLQMVSTLVFPFSVMQVKIQEELVGRSEVERSHLIKAILWKAPLFGLAITVGGFLIPLLLPFVGLSSFSGSVLLLQVLLLSIPLQGLIMVLQGVWVGLHRARLSSFVSLFYGGICLLVAVLFVAKMGVWAGVVGTFVASVVVLIGQFFSLRGIINRNMNEVPRT